MGNGARDNHSLTEPEPRFQPRWELNAKKEPREGCVADGSAGNWRNCQSSLLGALSCQGSLRIALRHAGGMRD